MASTTPQLVRAGLEVAHDPLRLPLEWLAALVEPLPRAPLRLGGELLGAPRHVAALFPEELPGLRPGLRRQQEGRRGAERRAQKEPAEIARGVASLVTHGCLLRFSGGAGRRPPRPSSLPPPARRAARPA